jgi:excisionase family DNA binding protein
MAPDGELIGLKEAAELLGIGTTTLHRWAVMRKVRYYEVGPFRRRRFRRSDIEALVRERQAKGEKPTKEQGR